MLSLSAQAGNITTARRNGSMVPEVAYFTPSAEARLKCSLNLEQSGKMGRVLAHRTDKSGFQSCVASNAMVNRSLSNPGHRLPETR